MEKKEMLIQVTKSLCGLRDNYHSRLSELEKIQARHAKKGNIKMSNFFLGEIHVQKVCIQELNSVIRYIANIQLFEELKEEL